MKVEDLIIELQKLNPKQEIFIYSNTMGQEEKIGSLEENKDGTYSLCSIS
jgi:hypothetical protein